MPAITVPRLGWSMEEGTFVEWLKADGDAVSVGEPLFVLESDKSAETIESLDAGVLRIPADAPRGGETVKVGQVLGYVGESVPAPPGPLSHTGERGSRAVAATDDRSRDLSCSPSPPRVGAPAGATREEKEAPAGATREEKEAPAAATREEMGRGGRGVRGGSASPRARRAARELGVDWRALSGTGRDGRVRERDVRAGTAEGRLVPHTGTRKVIAARMVAGVTQAAPVTLTTKADVTDLVALRDGMPSISYLALVLKAVGRALREHPALRSQWRDEGLFVPEKIHLAFAVDAGTGLFAPVVRDADRLGLAEIANRCRSLAAQARAGTLTAEEMRGAVFTVSNLGMFGIDAFTPIIHLPQCAVLGVGRIVREPAVVGDAVVPRHRMALSLTFDHRVTDGAPAARFLDAVRASLELPDSLSSPD